MEDLAWRGTSIPWELAEIDGMASRLMTGDHPEQLLAVFQRGVGSIPATGSSMPPLASCCWKARSRHGEGIASPVAGLLEEYDRDQPDYAEIEGRTGGIARRVTVARSGRCRRHERLHGGAWRCR